MRILTITATEFGLFQNRVFTLNEGLNLITGENESGKSTLGALITFLLYGFPARDQRERLLRLSREGRRAAGEMTIVKGGSTYRIRRTYLLRSLSGRTAPLEECKVTDATGAPLDLGGKQPGEYFLGIPREIFEATVLARQSEIDTVNTADTGEAVTNLLFLDGGTGLDGALRALDAARRTLQHTRGRGGLLTTLDDERAEIEADLQDARERSGRLHDLRARAAALTADLGDKERELAALTAGARAGELDTLLAGFTALREAENEITRLKNNLREQTQTGTSTKHPDTETLAAIDRAVSLWESLTAERDRALSAIGEAQAAKAAIARDARYCAIEAAGGAAPLKDKLAELFKKSRRLGVLSLILLLLSAGATALFFAPFGGQMRTLAVAALCASLFAAALSLLLRRGTKGKEKAVYRALGLDGAVAIAPVLAAHAEMEKRLAAATESERVQERLATTLTEKITLIRGGLSDTAVSLGLSADIPPRDLLSHALALATAEKAAGDGDAALLSALAAARARRDMLAAPLAALDEAALRLERQTLGGRTVPLSPDEAERRRAFLEEARRGISAKLLAVAREEAALAAKETDITTLETALAENKARTRVASDRLAAITLACEVLAEANAEMQNDLLPQVAREAADILAYLTDGRYKKLYLDTDFAASLDVDGTRYPLSSFSAGCLDAVGLSLRLALARVLTKEPLPLLLDEVTARLDDGRTKNLLATLSRLAANGTQILLFSCHTREARILQEMDAAFEEINLPEARLTNDARGAIL